MITEEKPACYAQHVGEFSFKCAIRPDLARDLNRRGWIGVKDTADLFELSEKTVLRRIKLGFKKPAHPLSIPVLPFGKPYRVSAAWVRRFVEFPA